MPGVDGCRIARPPSAGGVFAALVRSADAGLLMDGEVTLSWAWTMALCGSAGGTLVFESGDELMLFVVFEALGFLGFFTGTLPDGGGVSLGDSCGERSELMSMMEGGSRINEGIVKHYHERTLPLQRCTIGEGCTPSAGFLFTSDFRRLD